jgi:hypothetical protein
MKKTVKSGIFILLSCMAMLSAGPVENLYTFVVPQTYGSLYLNGALGSSSMSLETNDALQIDFDFDPLSLGITAGANANYIYEKQTLDSSLAVDATGTLLTSDTVSFLNFTETGYYKSYTIQIKGIPGFYALGLTSYLRPSLSSGTFSYIVELQPMGALGIGRIYSVGRLKQIQSMFKYLAIPYTEQTVKTAAEFLDTQTGKFTQYSQDNRLNFTNYYRDFANALNVPEKALNLVFIDQLQEYAFEKARFEDLRYGWEAQVALSPFVSLYSYSTNFVGASMILSGTYGNFYMQDKLHFQGTGSTEVTYSTEPSTGFSFDVTIGGRARYLPENYHWWFDTGLEATFSLGNSTSFDLGIKGELHYLLTPNFVTYAGIEIHNIFTTYNLYAGGRYRIW